MNRHLLGSRVRVYDKVYAGTVRSCTEEFVFVLFDGAVLPHPVYPEQIVKGNPLPLSGEFDDKET